jgi:transposase
MIDYTSQTKYSNFSINKHSLQAVFGIPGVVFYDSVIRDNLIFLSARLKAKTAKCPSCGKRSKSVHSSYMRKLTDLSSSGRAVKIIFKVRKFRCRSSSCTQTIFSEQHLPLTQRYSRLTERTTHYLQRLLS